LTLDLFSEQSDPIKRDFQRSKMGNPQRIRMAKAQE